MQPVKASGRAVIGKVGEQAMAVIFCLRTWVRTFLVVLCICIG